METDENLKDLEEWYLNYYKCPCGHRWTDEWSCMCNDKCPKCGKEIEPYESQELIK